RWPLQHDWLVGQLVQSRGAARKVQSQKRVDRLDAADRAFFKLPVAVLGLHLPADRVPGRVAYTPVNAAIGNDLHCMIGEQEVHKELEVLLGIPDPQAAEDLERTLAWRVSA